MIGRRETETEETVTNQIHLKTDQLVRLKAIQIKGGRNNTPISRIEIPISPHQVQTGHLPGPDHPGHQQATGPPVHHPTDHLIRINGGETIRPLILTRIVLIHHLQIIDKLWIRRY